MGEHAYLERRPALPPRGIPISSPVNIPCTLQDYRGSYISAGSYGSYPMAYESSIPTPVSVGSPSLHDEGSPRIPHSFSPIGRGSCQPASPCTPQSTHSEWFNHSNGSIMPMSQCSSPITMHGMPNLMPMNGLEGSQPSDVRGGPMNTTEQYHWGSYGVSCTESQDDMSPHMQSSALFSTLPHVSPSAVLKNTYMPGSPISMAPAPTQVPLMHTSSNIGGLGPPMTTMEGVESTYGPIIHPQPLIVDMYPSSKRAPRARATRRNNQKKGARDPSPNFFACDDHETTQGHQNTCNDHSGDCARLDVNKLRLKPVGNDISSPSERDHYIFNLRCQLSHLRGKGMWDRILELWQERYEPKERAALQMQLTRAVAAHAIWPKDEDKALLEALAEYDKQRYDTILKIMKERGGCRAWDWRPAHIVKRLVELGEEELDVSPSSNKARKKRKQVQRLRAGTNVVNATPAPNAVYDDEGLCIESHTTLTVEETDMLLSNLLDTDLELEDIQDEEESATQASTKQRSTVARANNKGTNKKQSERVAKQACEKLIAKHQGGPLLYHGNRQSI
ncbi:hypothetical protein BX600DRAFT_430296 [Xylariales sp. PMI_506]|nr:hypothetical protein BX600DRAFT_430296 [Xylariales sp. PMI_506]